MNRKISQPSTPQEQTETPSSESGAAQSDTKEILFLTGGLLALVFGLSGLMMYSDEEPLPATASQEINRSQMTQAFTSTDSQPPIPAPFNQTPAEELVTDPIIPINGSNTGQSAGSIDAPIAEPAAGLALEGTDVYFAFNEWTLSDEAKEAIKTRVENRPEGWTGTINIVGYTDPQGPDAYNRALGFKRARSVQSYLVSLGVPESDIQVETLGKDIQVCQEETPTCFEQNRRAHVAFLPSSTTQGEDFQLSMTPASVTASASQKAEQSEEHAPAIPSDRDVSLHEEIQEESVTADPLVHEEPRP